MLWILENRGYLRSTAPNPVAWKTKNVSRTSIFAARFLLCFFASSLRYEHSLWKQAYPEHKATHIHIQFGAWYLICITSHALFNINRLWLCVMIFSTAACVSLCHCLNYALSIIINTLTPALLNHDSIASNLRFLLSDSWLKWHSV